MNLMSIEIYQFVGFIFQEINSSKKAVLERENVLERPASFGSIRRLLTTQRLSESAFEKFTGLLFERLPLKLIGSGEY